MFVLSLNGVFFLRFVGTKHNLFHVLYCTSPEKVALVVVMCMVGVMAVLVLELMLVLKKRNSKIKK